MRKNFIQIVNERNRIVLKNMLLNYSGKFIFYSLSFLSISLTLAFLGKEKFGVFQTFLTFISWGMLANLGLSNGLRNKISEYIGVGRPDELRGLIASAFHLSFIVLIVLLLLGSLFFLYAFDASWLFKNLDTPQNEVELSFYVIFLSYSLNLFLSLFSSIAYGIHKSYLVTYMQVFQYLLFCLFIYLLIKKGFDSNLLLLSILYGSTLIIAQLVLFFSFFRERTLWPPDFTKKSKFYKELFSMSMSFFFLQLSSVILFSSDNFILSKLLGPEEVAEYSIINKVFFFIINLFSVVLIQVWNSTTDANACKDYLWIKEAVVKLTRGLILVFAVSLIISLLLNYITVFWIGGTFTYSITIRLFFVLYVVFHCANAIYVNVLNGLGRLKWQTIAYFFAACLNFILSYLFISKAGLGINGVLYSKTICVLLTFSVCWVDYKNFFIALKK